ncbi:MAG: hypothetical protein JO095_12225 [Alphaproteobacteria bacterium]|nr:hypothetical protein [Alphaproteobacteria bacterium]
MQLADRSIPILEPGNPDLDPENAFYFSIDGGATNINTFNGTGGGDLSDWLGLTPEAFDHALTRGQEAPFTAADLIPMDVIGYDLSPVPETREGLALLAFPAISLFALRRLRLGA